MIPDLLSFASHSRAFKYNKNVSCIDNQSRKYYLCPERTFLFLNSDQFRIEVISRRSDVPGFSLYETLHPGCLYLSLSESLLVLF